MGKGLNPELNRIYQGDCIEILKGFADQSIDLIYADPPFNTGNQIGWYNRKYDGKGNDKLSPEEYAEFCKSWFKEARRVAKRLVITPGVGNIGLYPNPLWCVVIDKPSSPSFNRMGGFNCWEPAFIYDKPAKNKKLPRDVVRYDSQNFIQDGREEHPCPDNLDMVKWIVDTWSEEGETCLDPFLGSGSLAVAAKFLKRNYIGIEISPKYIKIAEERLRQNILL